MSVYALLTEKQSFWDANGNPLTGGFLFVYLAGTTTKATSYTETNGVTPNSNPIQLNSRGEVPAGLYVPGGATYKLVLAPATDTDPPTSPIWTRDNLTPTNDVSTSSALSEWITSAFAVSFSNATTFTIPGDVTSIYQVGRRVRATIGSGNLFGTIAASSASGVPPTTITTVVVRWDSGAMDATLSAVDYGLLSSTGSAVPVPADTAIVSYNVADPTKRVRWSAAVMPTNTTRTVFAGLPSSGRAGAYGLLEADYGGVIYCTSSFTLTLTTSLGAGFQVWVRNIGTGIITLSPTTGSIFFPGAAQAGAATATLPYSGSVEGPYNVSGVLLQCDGTNWYVVATNEAHGEQLFTASGSWVAPAGVTTIWLDGAAQGGGGGGVATNPGANAGAGGGGQSIVGVRYAVVPGTSYTVTLANTGGVGGPNGSTNGTAGSNAVFGALVTLTGGGGGTSSTGGSFTAGGAAGGAGGGAGGGGSVVSGSTATGGTGGGTHWGQGGVGQIGTHNGLAGSGYGAGGAGGVTATGSTQTGGAGSAGFFRVRW